MNYITMIFDLEGSRYLTNRYEVQLHLIETIKQCNELFHEMIASDFLITVGDEWEGLLRPNSDYRKIIQFFQTTLPSGICFYTGVGIGEISITDFELTVNQLDGPAFYKARDAIRLAKKEHYRTIIIE